MPTLLDCVRKWRAQRIYRTKPVIKIAGILSLYTLITLLITWPAVNCLSLCIAGYPSGDQPIAIWGLWHGKEALLKGQNPALLATLNYPHGYFSPVRLAMLTIPMLAIPLELLFHPIVVYNLAFLLSFVITGCVGFLLCRDITGDWRGALVGGGVLMLFPLRVTHALAGHIEIASLFIPVIYVMLLRRTALKPSYRMAFFTGFTLALASMSFITTPPYFLIPWTIVYLSGLLVSGHEQFKYPSTWLTLGLTGLVAVAITLPFFVPLIQSALRPGSELRAEEMVLFSTDLLGYISPLPSNPILGALGLIPPFAENVLKGTAQETTAYLGLIPIILAIFALVRREREARIWLAAALVAMVFALGPYLKIGGKQATLSIEGSESSITMPYAVLTQLPIYSIGRDPGRFNLITGLALSVLAAQGMTAWIRKQKVWQSTMLVVVVTAGIAGEYLVGWPIEMTREGLFPSAIDTLSKEQPTGGVINVPLHDYWVKEWGAYYQIEHGWPIFDGSYARNIPDIPGRLEMLDWITSTTTEGDIIPAIPPAAARAFLAHEGVAYLLLHRNNTQDFPAIERHSTALLGRPIATDPTIALYRIEARPDASKTLYALGQKQGWGWVEEWNGEPARWLTKSGDLIIYSPQDATGVLNFRSLAGDRPRHLTITSEIGKPRALIVAQYMSYILPEVELQAGYNVFHFEAKDSCWNVNIIPQCAVSQSLTGFFPGNDCWLSPQGQRCIDILFQNIRFEPIPETLGYHPLSVTLGQDIELIAYRLENSQIQPNSLLTLTLIWQAQGTPPQNYNLFVHLFDPRTGKALTQYDGPPLNGAFPTSYWKSGDVVQTKITLQVPDNTSPGEYPILVGMYSYPNIERLPVNSNQPYAENNTIWLQDLKVIAP